MLLYKSTFVEEGGPRNIVIQQKSLYLFMMNSLPNTDRADRKKVYVSSYTVDMLAAETGAEVELCHVDLALGIRV